MYERKEGKELMFSVINLPNLYKNNEGIKHTAQAHSAIAATTTYSYTPSYSTFRRIKHGKDQ